MLSGRETLEKAPKHPKKWRLGWQKFTGCFKPSEESKDKFRDLRDRLPDPFSSKEDRDARLEKRNARKEARIARKQS